MTHAGVTLNNVPQAPKHGHTTPVEALFFLFWAAPGLVDNFEIM